MLRGDARRFAFDTRALGEIGRALKGLPGATVRVGGCLVRAILHGAAGRQAAVPFDIGLRGEPAEAGRRALVVLATSLAPDSFVLRVPGSKGQLLYHALSGHVPGGDRRWPA